ncbi:MAG: DUF3299 domain-containing protein [Bacteroidetes bacterium]|nr:MAG: DUF3299 domain-containing protein [Bacteroidota bacterium]
MPRRMGALGWFPPCRSLPGDGRLEGRTRSVSEGIDHAMHRIWLLVMALGLAPGAVLAQQQISWDTLAQVQIVRGEQEQFVPRFEPPVQALAGKEVRLKGFMMPLDQAAEQQHFILSAAPVANCFFCMPGGPESLIEVLAAETVPFTYDPIEVTGTLELLEDDPMGMYYRIRDARVAR